MPVALESTSKARTLPSAGTVALLGDAETLLNESDFAADHRPVRSCCCARARNMWSKANCFARGRTTGRSAALEMLLDREAKGPPASRVCDAAIAVPVLT